MKRISSHKKVAILLARIPITTVGILSLGWFLVMGLWALLRGCYSQYNLAPIIDYLWIGFGFGLMGLAGAIAAKQREFPQLIVTHGTFALVLGIFVAMTGWGVTLYMLYKAILLAILYL